MAKNNNQELKGKLQKANQQPQGSGQGQGDTVSTLVEKMKPSIQKALPSQIGLERFTRIAMTTLRQNPKLMNCDKMSLMGAIMQAAQLGLEPNILGSCYILPYKNEATFIIGYRGMIDLARRSGNIKSIYAHEVRENDEFEYEYGLYPDLKHKPAMENRGKMIGVYAVAHFRDGGYQFEFMPVEEIEKRKNRSPSANATHSPWKSDYEEMAKKTVIRHMFKYLPVAVEREIDDIHGFDLDKDEGAYKFDEEAGEIEYIDVTEEEKKEGADVEGEKEAEAEQDQEQEQEQALFNQQETSTQA